MSYLVRTALLGMLILMLACSAWSHHWVNDLLVHRTPTWTENGDVDCLTCHSGEKMRAVGDSVHGDSTNPLTPFAQHGCESCHGPGSIHISRAHGGKGFPPLINFGHGQGASGRERQVAACQNCHNDESSGIAVTPFGDTVHDKMVVNCSSCHQSHIEQDPVLDRSQQAEICLSCHSRQLDGHPQVGNRVPDFGRMGCAGCHRVHRLPKPEQSED